MRSISRELWRFLRARKKVWLMPVILWLAIILALVIVAESSAIGPYIYSLF